MKLFQKISESISTAVGFLIFLTFLIFIIIMNAASLSSCFHTPKDSQIATKNIIKADTNNFRHKKILDRFKKVYEIDESKDTNIEIRFTNDNALIAASLGNGNFLLSESLFDLPNWVIDGILAHEIAHDHLMHVRKTLELEDLRGFFVEALSLFTEKKTTDTLQVWSRNIVLPKYSRSQELKADEGAIEILNIHGYQNAPAIYIQALEYIRNRYGESGGGFFDLHPSLSERIENIKSIMANIPMIELWECTDNDCDMRVSPGMVVKEVWVSHSSSDKTKEAMIERFLFVPNNWEKEKLEKILAEYKNAKEINTVSLIRLQPFQQGKDYRVFEIFDQ